MKERQVRRASKTNISPEEWKAIKSLRSDNSIMIIFADKGNKTVILDKDLYFAKLRDRTSAHNLTNSDPAIAHEDALNAAIDIIMASTSNIKDRPELILQRSELKRFMTKDAFSPWLHGLIKLHKQGFPLREISDATSSPGHALGKMLNKIFADYTGNTKHHLSSHTEVIPLLGTGRFDGGFFVSCDAVELYPSIIIRDGLELLEEKMNRDKTWTKKTDLTRQEVLQLTMILVSEP